MLFDAALKAPPETIGFDGTEVAGELLDTGMTEGKGIVLDVTMLRVVAMGGCTIDEALMRVDTKLFGSTMSED